MLEARRPRRRRRRAAVDGGLDDVPDQRVFREVRDPQPIMEPVRIQIIQDALRRRDGHMRQPLGPCRQHQIMHAALRQHVQGALVLGPVFRTAGPRPRVGHEDRPSGQVGRPLPVQPVPLPDAPRMAAPTGVLERPARHGLEQDRRRADRQSGRVIGGAGRVRQNRQSEEQEGQVFHRVYSVVGGCGTGIGAGPGGKKQRSEKTSN